MDGQPIQDVQSVQSVQLTPVKLRGALWVLMAVFAFAYVYFFQYYERIPNPNEQTRAYLTVALADHHKVSIDEEIRLYGETIDVASFNGRSLCDKAPGLSMLGVPAYWAYSRISRALGHEPAFPEILKLLRVASVALPSLVLTLLVYWGLGLVEEDDRVRLPVIIVYALGTTVHTYSVLIFSHAVAAGMGASAFLIAMRLRRGAPAWLALPAGFLAGYAVLTEYPLLIAAAVTSVYLLFTSWRRPAVLAFFTAGALIPAAMLMVYNKAAFGGWLSLGYAHIANPYFAQFHKDGALGVSTPRLEAFAGSFFSSSRGYFPFQPWLLLAFPGLALMFNRSKSLRVECVAVAAAMLGFAYFISSFSYWQGGGTVSQRHLTALTPWLLIPITVLLSDAARNGSVFSQLSSAVAGLFSIAVITICTVPFPFFSTQYPNPLYELALRLWRYGMIPYSIGRNLGLDGLWAAVPYLLVVAAAAALFLKLSFSFTGPGSAPAPGKEYRRIRWKVLAAVVVVIAALAAYSLVERGRNLEGKTNDLWGIVTNYEPREGWCDLAVADAGDPYAPICNAFLGRTADALEGYRLKR